MLFFLLEFFVYVFVLVPSEYSLDLFFFCEMLQTINHLEPLLLNLASISLFKEKRKKTTRPVYLTKSIMSKSSSPGGSSSESLSHSLFLSSSLPPNPTPPPPPPPSWKTKLRDLWTSARYTVNPDHCVRFMFKISLEVCAYQKTAIRKLYVYLFLKMCRYLWSTLTRWEGSGWSKLPVETHAEE